MWNWRIFQKNQINLESRLILRIHKKWKGQKKCWCQNNNRRLVKISWIRHDRLLFMQTFQLNHKAVKVLLLLIRRTSQYNNNITSRLLSTTKQKRKTNDPKMHREMIGRMGKNDLRICVTTKENFFLTIWNMNMECNFTTTPTTVSIVCGCACECRAWDGPDGGMHEKNRTLAVVKICKSGEK